MLSTATVPARQPGVLLIFILTTGAIMLMLSGAVERVAEGAEGEAGVVSEHEAEDSDSPDDTTGAVTEDQDEGSEAASDSPDEEALGDAAAASPSATEEDHGETATEAESDINSGHSATGATGDTEEDHSSDASLLGIDLSRLNLAYPRLAVIAVVLTIIVAVAYAVAPMAGTLGAMSVVSAVAVVASVLEATHAGEEHGIFIPLPALAAVLYGGAGILAALRMAEGGSKEPALVHTGP